MLRKQGPVVGVDRKLPTDENPVNVFNSSLDYQKLVVQGLFLGKKAGNLHSP